MQDFSCFHLYTCIIVTVSGPGEVYGVNVAYTSWVRVAVVTDSDVGVCCLMCVIVSIDVRNW